MKSQFNQVLNSVTLVAAGVGRVVIAVLDPNPLVSGRGAEHLRAAGVIVDVLPPDSAQARTTRSNAVSARTSQALARRLRRKREARRNAPVSNTIRGSGHHHFTGSPVEYQGKIPAR